jgi:Rrf2 family protein
MKASLKLEYSLRVLSQLARRHRGTAVTRIEELARLEDIPANYLVQLLNELREGGLVSSKRGKTGGYRLAKDAEDITLKQVLAVVEPELVETKITLKGASGALARSLEALRQIAHRLHRRPAGAVGVRHGFRDLSGRRPLGTCWHGDTGTREEVINQRETGNRIVSLGIDRSPQGEPR